MNGAAPAGGKPWLFCDSSWLLRKAWIEQAQAPDGTFLTLNGASVSIQTQYPNLFASAGRRLPWWISQFNTYMVLLVKDASGYCSTSSGNLAGTQDTTMPGTITLCPVSFTFTPGEISVERCWDWQNIAHGDALQANGGCKALTLFHEMFHLVIGTAPTPDNGLCKCTSCQA